jgi:hypothetical protein
MKDACPLSPMEQHEAQLVRKLVEQVGGLKNAAYFIGKSKSQIARYQSAHHHDSITLRDIGKLEERTVGQGGHPLITRYLANQSGHVLVALPTETTGPAHLILNDLADGEINHPQAGIDECFDLLRVTAGLVEALKQLADD